MKILQICSKLPYPPKDGGALAMHMLTKGLINAGNEVQVVAVDTPKQSVKAEHIHDHYRKQTNFSSVFIDTEIRAWDAFRNLFGSESYNVSRFHSAKMEDHLNAVIASKHFDVVILDSLWVTPYIDCIRKNSKAKLVFRPHNIEYRIWERLAANCGNPIRRWYLSLLAARLKKYELSVIPKVDAILPITPEDEAVFRTAGAQHLFCLPFGIETNSDSSAKHLNNSFYYIGAMDWQPNIEGVRWLLEDVWPLVEKKNAELKLHLAGRKMTKEMPVGSSRNVIVHAEVPDAGAFMRDHGVMLVPLLSGGGMRVKIIEAMAAGRAIISTAIGAEGSGYTTGRNMVIADSPEQFASEILRLSNNPELCDRLGAEAKALAYNKFDNNKICSDLSSYLNKLN
jgi:glycosyltransferase involved in cell wall biosynthesis